MMPTPQRNSYTFKDGLTMMAAKAVGIDPYLAAEAGENARVALNAIRNALKTKQPKERAGYIREAQNELRTISAAQHPKLVNALQAKLLALQGRGGDTAVAHVEPGEMVLPRAMLTPDVMRLIASEAAKRGIDPRRLMVGGQASINPATGAEEFGWFGDALDGFGNKVRDIFGFKPAAAAEPDMRRLDVESIPVTVTRRNESLIEPITVTARKKVESLTPDPLYKKYADYVDLAYRAGMPMTAENLQHYLLASGQDREIPAEQLRRFKTIQDAEQENRNKFVNQTFTKWNPTTDAGRKALAALNGIKDGEAIRISDNWPSHINNEPLWQAPFSRDRDLKFALGRSMLSSTSDVNITRKGNQLTIDGDIKHQISDPYDFHSNAFLADGALDLERQQKAKRYNMRSSWSEPIHGTVEMEVTPDNSVVRKNPSFKFRRSAE